MTEPTGLRLPEPRGAVSRMCLALMTGPARAPAADLDFPGALADLADLADVDTIVDDDVQLALWMLYELHYRGFDDVDPAAEWDPRLLAVRAELERRFEAGLRARTREAVDEALAAAGDAGDVAESVFALCARDDAPAVVPHVHDSGDRTQLLELLVHRSVYQLKEADPYTWLVPRLHGEAKTSLLEIQYDEYGAGRAEHVHATLFANTLRACGLDPAYGAYVGRVPGATLAVGNTASMFGLHRRLRGAGAGHFAAVEATSSLPSRKMSSALRRCGYGPDATYFFDEHVEADAVHEQVATRGLCGALVGQHPELRRDVLFGAAAYLLVEGMFAARLLDRWRADLSSLCA